MTLRKAVLIALIAAILVPATSIFPAKATFAQDDRAVVWAALVKQRSIYHPNDSEDKIKQVLYWLDQNGFFAMDRTAKAKFLWNCANPGPGKPPCTYYVWCIMDSLQIRSSNPTADYYYYKDKGQVWTILTASTSLKDISQDEKNSFFLALSAGGFFGADYAKKRSYIIQNMPENPTTKSQINIRRMFLAIAEQMKIDLSIASTLENLMGPRETWSGQIYQISADKSAEAAKELGAELEKNHDLWRALAVEVFKNAASGKTLADPWKGAPIYTFAIKQFWTDQALYYLYLIYPEEKAYASKTYFSEGTVTKLQNKFKESENWKDISPGWATAVSIDFIALGVMDSKRVQAISVFGMNPIDDVLMFIPAEKLLGLAGKFGRSVLVKIVGEKVVIAAEKPALFVAGSVKNVAGGITIAAKQAIGDAIMGIESRFLGRFSVDLSKVFVESTIADDAIRREGMKSIARSISRMGDDELYKPFLNPDEVIKILQNDIKVVSSGHPKIWSKTLGKEAAGIADWDGTVYINENYLENLVKERGETFSSSAAHEIMHRLGTVELRGASQFSKYRWIEEGLTDYMSTTLLARQMGTNAMKLTGYPSEVKVMIALQELVARKLAKEGKLVSEDQAFNELQKIFFKSRDLGVDLDALTGVRGLSKYMQSEMAKGLHGPLITQLGKYYVPK